MKINAKIIKSAFFGIIIGFINGLFGAGGGMIAVPLLKSMGLPQKNAHATSISIILPLCIFSVILYTINGNIEFLFGLKLIPFGIIGAVLGTFIMKKISPKLLKRIFSIFLIYAGIKMIIGN